MTIERLNPKLIAQLDKALGNTYSAERMLMALNSPSSDTLFSDKGDWSFLSEHDRGLVSLVCHDDQYEFHERVLTAATVSVAFLTYYLPARNVVHKNVRDLFLATRSALENPNLKFYAGCRFKNDTANTPPLELTAESMIGKFQSYKSIRVADDGVALAAINYGSHLELAFRPGALKQNSQYDRLRNQLRPFFSDIPAVGDQYMQPIEHLRIFQSDEFAALIDRAGTTPVPCDHYESNPRYSAPEIVKLVAKVHELSENAAVYYLQLLTLPDPTDKNIASWNGWSSTIVKSLGKELLSKQLVIEATRSRASRRFFLPGSWEELKSPCLPLETWKMPLYKLTRDESKKVTAPLGTVLPLAPVHMLFAQSWQRVLAGDVPGYKDL